MGINPAKISITQSAFNSAGRMVTQSQNLYKTSHPKTPTNSDSLSRWPLRLEHPNLDNCTTNGTNVYHTKL